MYSIDRSNRMIGLVVSTAMAGALLSSCASNTAPRADMSASAAQESLAEGQHDSAVSHAEEAVLAEPRNASYRAVLGNAYIDAGRFASAETSFNDAMALGDNSPRTALSLALALTAQARYSEAAALLNDWEGAIATADLGLALSLAGQPERGIHIMSNAIRGGQNTVKMRQNLAYAYAMAGRWREARLMAAEDIPADQLNDRIGQWAALTAPETYQQRVAGLLGVPAGVRDAGQPTQLALANFPVSEQLTAEASAYPAPEQREQAEVESVAIPASGSELPAVGEPAIALDGYEGPQTGQPTEFESAFAAGAPSGGSLAQVTQGALRFVQEPVVQTVPVRHGAAPEPRISGQASRPVAQRSLAAQAPAKAGREAAAPADRSSGTHLVQLGSFASEQGARRAWGVYVARYPELADSEMVITEALVRGKRYWRVSAGGYSRAESRSVCRRIDSNQGEGCIAWADGSPLPGAVDTGVRLARR